MTWLSLGRFPACGLLLAILNGCGPNYSPDTYASNAVQQANKVEQGVIVGVRNVGVSAAGTVGTVTGAAAGGIAGAQAGAGPVSAFTSLGGALVGGLAGSAVEHASADTAAFEYIVRKPNGDLVSVTQKDKMPLTIGTHVLVITGNQARIVQDYTVPADVLAKTDKPAAAGNAPPGPAAGGAVKLDQPAAPITATPLPPPAGTSAPSGTSPPAGAASQTAAAPPQPPSAAPSPATPSTPAPSPAASGAAQPPAAASPSAATAPPAAPLTPLPGASAVGGALAAETHP